MKIKLLIMMLVGVVSISLQTKIAHAEWSKWKEVDRYLAVEIGQHDSKMRSGGFNTAGAFENTNNDEANGKLFSIKAGVEINKWKFDIGYRQYESQDYTTDGFRPPTPIFFYDSKLKAKAVMVTAYYDFYEYNKLDFYGGAGIGESRVEISTTDGVVEGSGSETNFFWQVELGVEDPITNSLVLNVGLRYVDLGKTEINLHRLGGGAQAGNFTADLTSEELFFGLRYIF